jgi:hypothetical protein
MPESDMQAGLRETFDGTFRKQPVPVASAVILMKSKAMNVKWWCISRHALARNKQSIACCSSVWLSFAFMKLAIVFG